MRDLEEHWLKLVRLDMGKHGQVTDTTSDIRHAEGIEVDSKKLHEAMCKGYKRYNNVVSKYDLRRLVDKQINVKEKIVDLLEDEETPIETEFFELIAAHLVLREKIAEVKREMTKELMAYE